MNPGSRTPTPWAILVIWQDGDEEYLKQGMSAIPAKFSNRNDAIEQTKFMKIGMEGEVQSINIVPYPKKEDWQ